MVQSQVMRSWAAFLGRPVAHGRPRKAAHERDTHPQVVLNHAREPPLRWPAAPPGADVSLLSARQRLIIPVMLSARRE
jgi:hypothetical protein